MSTSADSVGVCLVNQTTAADARAIESGLHELWRLAEAGEIGGSVIRAASLTLVVPLVGEKSADDVTALLDSLTETHPLRAILVLPDERIEEPRARLANHYRPALDGEAARYWEEIRLVSPPEVLRQVMTSVAALALPNLPIQGWWPGRPAFDDDLYNHIVEVCDRLIVDSSGFRGPVPSLRELDLAITAAREATHFADLSWTRLTPWRALTAEFFDPPLHQELLDSIERVAVRYGTETGGEASQALLFVGWLASRLGWEPKEAVSDRPGDWRIVVLDGARPVIVEVAHDSHDDSSTAARSLGGLQRLSLEATEDGRQASFTIERCGDGQEARTVAEIDGGQLEGQTHLPAQSQAELLRDELGSFSTDRIYQEALSIVARMLPRD